MLDTREELIDRATVWTLDEGRRHLYDEIAGRVSPIGHSRDYVRRDMANFALNCERELIASIGCAIQKTEAVKDGDEDGHYAQGFIDTKRQILKILQDFYVE